MLFDYSEKPVAYANFAATDSRAALQYNSPRDAEGFRLQISGLDPAVVLILAVYLRRQEMRGRQAFVSKVDRYVIAFHPLAHLVTIGVVTWLFQ